jgi:PAS domain S-box-containing protein
MRRCPICARQHPPAARTCERHHIPLVETSLTSELGIEGPLSGHVLDDRYLLAGLVGRGGMGAVYEGENLRIGRRVAVKVLLPELHADPKARQRLFREVLATSRIRHPNVVEIYDYGDDERAGAYFVMEFLDGRSLGALVRERGRVEPKDALRLLTQLCAALAATHGHGLIHRDLKPSNIRITPEGVVKVLDFGLVKGFEGRRDDEVFATITTGGIAFGTPWYMSPEQASFQPLDPRSDLYSLGVVAYEMLCGRTPFTGKNPLDLVDAQRHQKPPLPSDLEPPVKLPTVLELLLLKMLAKAPEERHQSVSELMDDVYGIADELRLEIGEPVAALAYPTQPLRAEDVTDDAPKDLEGGDKTIQVTAPFWPPDELTASVQELAHARKDQLAEAVAEELRAHIPRYRTVKKEMLLAGVRVVIEIAASALTEELREVPEPIKRLADERAQQQFSVTETIGAFLIGMAACRPLLREVTGDNLDRYLTMTQEIDRRVTSLLLKIIDLYFARYNQRLVRQSEMLSRRNDELSGLRQQLSEQLRSTAGQLADVERLKAKVTQHISSGLVLVERGSHRILLFNAAMERLTGLRASEVVGRSINDVMHFVEGIPFREFAEQLRMHGEVGLRKLQLRMVKGRERAVYVRGQLFETAGDQPDSTLYVVDDVTEREHIIESFSRYVSRAVVDRVLSRPQAGVEPSGELKHAVLLACGIRDFRKLVKDQGTPMVTELLTEYIRTVGDAVFGERGTIDSVVGDAILVYFSAASRDGEADCRPAVNAALTLRERFERLNEAREKTQKPPLLVGVGVHIGEIFVLDVGNERRMVHTVVGEAALIAQALQDVASGGEILVSSKVREQSGECFAFEPGPYLAVKNQAPIEAFRLVGLDADGGLADTTGLDVTQLDARPAGARAGEGDDG